MNPINALFGFRGRMRRRDFWVYVALFWIAYAALIVASADILYRLSSFTPSRSVGLSVLMSLPLVAWIYVALHIKRLHDVGYPATAVISTLWPILGWIWGFAECGLRDGIPGGNRYGPSPKGKLGVAEMFD